MSASVSVESWVGRVARWLCGRAASVWAALPERPRAWAEANGAHMGCVAASWARAAGQRIALAKRCAEVSGPLIAFAAPLDHSIGRIHEGTTTLAKATSALSPLE